MRRTLAILAGLAAAVLAVRAAILRRRSVAHIQRLDDHTVTDASGAVRSIQSADVTLPAGDLDRLWSPMYLERLARTYWRFLTRVTLGMIRVKYTDRERFVCLLFRPFVLLRFQAPEYEMNATRGIVRWRIESGVLVSARGRGGNGYLEIDVERYADADPGRARVHLEVEVANFYPAIAHSISRWVYENTQSRMHVIVTKGFLRSLARLDLAPSKVGRLAPIAALPDPSREREPVGG